MAAISGANIVNDGLILYLDPTNTNTYSGFGTTAYNLIPGGINNFSLVNGVAYDLDRSGSFYFDGTNDYINIPRAGLVYGSGPKTLMAWAKLSSYVDGVQVIASYGSGPNATFFISVYRLTGQSGGYNNDLFGGTVTLNTWFHICNVYDGTTAYLYFNGALMTSGAKPWNVTSTTYDGKIGAQIEPQQYFNGNISQVQLYNRALSAQEILQIYNATKSRFNTTENIITNGLVLNVDAGKSASYPGTGTTIYDLSGSGLTGTLVSSPTFSSLNGGSLVFGGSSYITRSSALDTGQNFSVTAWIYPTSLGARNAIVGNGYPYTTDNGWLFCICDNNFSLFQALFLSIGQNNVLKISNSYVFQLNKWSHVSCSVSGGGSSVKFYVNGVETSYGFIIQTSRTISYSNNEFHIGMRHSSTTERFGGNISQVQIYNTSLTAQEILQNYNATKSRYINVLPPVSDGLILNLDAGNRASYAGAGTTWVDLSSNRISASLVDGPVFAGTGVSTYFSFDGTNDHVDIPTTLSVNASSFTYEAVFRITTGADGNSLFSLNYSSPSSGYLIRQTTGNNLIVYTNIGTEPSISSNSVISNNTIYHLTVVQSGGSCSIYFNGTLDKTASLANPVLTSSNPTFIGRRGLPIYGAQLSGNIYLTKLYNRALTAAEVVQNFNFYRSRYGI